MKIDGVYASGGILEMMAVKTKVKNAAAVELGKKRWEGIEQEDRAAAGSAAATSRWENATPEDKAEIGRKLAAARAAKKAATNKAVKKKAGK